MLLLVLVGCSCPHTHNQPGPRSAVRGAPRNNVSSRYIYICILRRTLECGKSTTKHNNSVVDSRIKECCVVSCALLEVESKHQQFYTTYCTYVLPVEYSSVAATIVNGFRELVLSTVIPIRHTQTASILQYNSTRRRSSL